MDYTSYTCIHCYNDHALIAGTCYHGTGQLPTTWCMVDGFQPLTHQPKPWCVTRYYSNP